MGRDPAQRRCHVFLLLSSRRLWISPREISLKRCQPPGASRPDAKAWGREGRGLASRAAPHPSVKMTENADVTTPETAPSEISKEAPGERSGSSQELPGPLLPSHKSLYGRRKRIPYFKKSLFLPSSTQCRGQGKTCAFIFLNSLADFPLIWSSFFSGSLPPSFRRSKRETGVWLFFLSWTS